MSDDVISCPLAMRSSQLGAGGERVLGTGDVGLGELHVRTVEAGDADDQALVEETGPWIYAMISVRGESSAGSRSIDQPAAVWHNVLKSAMSSPSPAAARARRYAPSR